MFAAIQAVDYYLPARTLTNAALAREFPGWSPEKIIAKTGIENRHLAGEAEYASDLAVAAARKLLNGGVLEPAEIDFLLVCTQSPDYLLPTTACLVQSRLGLPTTVGAFDINLGCSGYVYGLSVAKGLVESGQARNVLLITVETYSKYMAANDFSVRALFGDAAAATLIRAVPKHAGPQEAWIGPFVFGTDGTGVDQFILRSGGARQTNFQVGTGDAADGRSSQGPGTCAGSLYMNGPEIFTFTLRVVPDAVDRLLQASGVGMGDIDQFVFHQANEYMLEHLRRKLGIPAEKFVYAMSDCGNTTSSSIPIALRRASEDGRIRPGNLVMLVGFGVGYSWGAALVRWWQD